MKEAWTLHSCIICILSEIINLSNLLCGVWEITSRCGFASTGGTVHPLADPHRTTDLIRNNAKMLPHGSCTKQALIFCGCTSACTEPERRGLCLQAVRGTPIIVSLSRLEVAVCQEYSTLLLIVQGLEDYLMQGNCDEGELLWRAEATAGSCASLPGPVDVCAGGVGAGQKADRYVSANCTSDCSVDTVWV